MKLVGAMAVAALVVAAVVTTYARSAGVSPERPNAAPGAPPKSSPSPDRTGKIDVDLGSMGSTGLNVRYLDDDGDIKDLGVQDFPR